jgi:hypothetical protein
MRSVEIPASVESIIDFAQGSLSQFILAEGTMIRKIKIEDCWWSVGRTPQRVCVTYGEGDLRKRRCRANMV